MKNFLIDAVAFALFFLALLGLAKRSSTPQIQALATVAECQAGLRSEADCQWAAEVVYLAEGAMLRLELERHLP